jgi:hypothetical protein
MTQSHRKPRAKHSPARNHRNSRGSAAVRLRSRVNLASDACPACQRGVDARGRRRERPDNLRRGSFALLYGQVAAQASVEPVAVVSALALLSHSAVSPVCRLVGVVFTDEASSNANDSVGVVTVIEST